MQDDASAGGRGGVSTLLMERVVALILLVIGVVVCHQSRLLGAGWTNDGPGAGYFPFYIGLIISISGVGVLLQQVLGERRDDSVFADAVQLGRVASVLVPAALYVLCVQFVGIYVGSAVYIALFMIVLGKYSCIRSVIAALVVSALFFVMFEVWFKVPLFKGRFDLIGAFA